HTDATRGKSPARLVPRVSSRSGLIHLVPACPVVAWARRRARGGLGNRYETATPASSCCGTLRTMGVRRTLSVFVALGLLASVGTACGTSSSTRTVTVTKTRTVTTTTAAPPTDGSTVGGGTAISSTTPRCHTSQLGFTFATNGAAGSILIVGTLHNHSQAACSLFGYPGIGLLGKDGSSLPANVER